MGDVSLSRPRNPELPTTELRIDDVPKVYVDMLDARSIAEGMKRGPFVISILERWFRAEARKHMVVQRLLGSNPLLAEAAGNDTEPGELR